MKFFICIITYTLLSTNLWAQQTFTISGNVKNTRGENLQSVTVFVDGSDKYTMTDANGNYTFYKINPGAYQVVVSIVGYASERKTAMLHDKPATINFVLAEKVTLLKEVAIGTDSKRPEYLRLFTSRFLGNTENARSCTILNPQIIEFTTNKTILLATTPDFLIIENKNLGYRIKYLLKIFRFDRSQNLTSYTGDCIFEELPGNTRQQKSWKENRQKAYEGSFMHYLRSLYAGNSSQQGFKSYAFIKGAEPPTVEADTTDMHQYLTRVDSSFIKLAFKKTFNVVYKRIDITLLGRDRRTEVPITSAPDDIKVIIIGEGKESKNGVVSMYLDHTLVDRTGAYLDYRSFLLEGLWSALQVGDRLPYTYQPEENKTN